VQSGEKISRSTIVLNEPYQQHNQSDELQKRLSFEASQPFLQLYLRQMNIIQHILYRASFFKMLKPLMCLFSIISINAGVSMSFYPIFGLGQAQKCNWVKPVNWILTHPALDNVLFIVLFIFRGIKQTGVSFTGWIPFQCWCQYVLFH
jgi:glucan phosphoethanolaminetransferase (alkaline phosphatase superfamily)